MIEEKEPFYYRHNIMNEVGYHRPVTTPISMSETLTLRDQFAMASLQLDIGCDVEMIAIARKAYQMADAMLEARKEKK